MRKVVVAACAVLGGAAGLDTAQAAVQTQAVRVEHDPEARVRTARRFADDELARLEGQITTLSRRYNVRERTLWAIAEASGFDLNRRSFAEFIAHIDAQAQEVVSLRGELDRLNADFAALPDRNLGGHGAQLLAQVQSAIDEGRLEEAEQRLLEVVGLFARGVQQNEREWRRAVQSRAHILRISGRGTEAAAYLRQTRLGFLAAAQEATRQTAFALATDEANTHFQTGQRLGEMAELHRAVDVYRLDVLPLAPRATAPHDWSTTQTNLGNALSTLGERQSGEEGLRTLIEASAAYKAALEVITRADHASDWAATQTNLGNALRILGERRSGQDALRTLAEAKSAHESALEVTVRDEAPDNWATIQNNLGNALLTLGERQSGEESLRTLAQSSNAYKAALEIRTRAEAPYDWAATQNNLGIALQALGVRQSGGEALRALAEASSVYKAALEVITRAEAPYQWAATQTNLGIVLQTLGERQADNREALLTLAEAADVYKAALEILTPTAAPYQWAVTQNNLGNVLRVLGARQSGREALRSLAEAGDAYEAALMVFTRAEASYQWAATQVNRALLHWVWFEKTRERRHLERALDYARAARTLYEQTGAHAQITSLRDIITAMESL